MHGNGYPSTAPGAAGGGQPSSGQPGSGPTTPFQDPKYLGQLMMNDPKYLGGLTEGKYVLDLLL